MVVIIAHEFSSQHRAQIEASEICGCFYCLQMFSPSNIEEWVDSEQTALCPKCGIDSVVGSASVVPLTQNFLKDMHDQWF
jgi:formate dehydrogenase maturation protein FdhE